MTISLPPPSMDDQTYVPGETCSGLTAAHDGRDVRQYVNRATRVRLVMCAACAQVAADLGAPFLADRRSDAFRRDRGTVSGSLLTRLRGMVA